MSTVIKVENVSKQYRLGKVGTGTISHDLNRWWHQIRGKEDPYIKIGEVNDRTSKGESDYVWALKDINFEINQGDAVGIIGRNGAGKSTLLKILSRTTAPTTGTLKLKGRVASLLEVGTGFHPELSGRENIYLNGAILGMNRKEITRKFDEIVDFSGVERYIDTPVKRYSSGMYVRLAFAVAAHLESEILIVDEVLAVGDAEFQKKCLNKMGQVSMGDGRTVLFVSHNLHSLRSLCPNTILLKHGNIDQFDSTNLVIDNYLQIKSITENTSYFNTGSLNPVFLKSGIIKSRSGEQTDQFSADDEVIIEMEIQKNIALRGVYLHFTVVNSEGFLILETDSLEQKTNAIDSSRTGLLISRIVIPPRVLNSGRYYLNLGIASTQADNFQVESLENFLSFNVIAESTSRDQYRRSLLSTILSWDTQFTV